MQIFAYRRLKRTLSSEDDRLILLINQFSVRSGQASLNCRAFKRFADVSFLKATNTLLRYGGARLHGLIADREIDCSIRETNMDFFKSDGAQPLELYIVRLVSETAVLNLKLSRPTGDRVRFFRFDSIAHVVTQRAGESGGCGDGQGSGMALKIVAVGHGLTMVESVQKKANFACMSPRWLEPSRGDCARAAR